MKHRVRVRLVAECEVEMVVEAAPNEDPTDLTLDEERRAIALADDRPRWSVERIEEMP